MLEKLLQIDQELLIFLNGLHNLLPILTGSTCRNKRHEVEHRTNKKVRQFEMPSFLEVPNHQINLKL